jgi:23S rRNA (guanine1835-N2)-methyltransferase
VSTFGSVELVRSETIATNLLQAWDGADRLLLDLAAQHQPHAEPTLRVLIIDDHYGALTLNCAIWNVTGWTDSAVSAAAIASNATRNNVEVTALHALPVVDLSVTAIKQFDLVVWRIPRATAYLQQQLAVLQQYVDETTLIYAAGLDKYLPPTTRELLSQLGEVATLPGAYKAHAFQVMPHTANLRTHIVPPKPAKIVVNSTLTVSGGPNVFSNDRLDLGARTLLGVFDRLPEVRHVADLGCGNGVLGLAIKQQQTHAHVAFFDESAQAVRVAETNAANSVGKDKKLTFHWLDGMNGYSGELFDLVLCNPPFHEMGAVTDDTAWAMFQQAKQNLIVDGELWVVGNRHLDYHVKLKRIFGNCTQVGAHPKFVVLRCVKLAPRRSV